MRNSNMKRISSMIAIGAIILSSVTIGSIINEDSYAANIPNIVKAISIKDQYIRINWGTDYDAGTDIQYEVYVIEGGRREYVGTTPDKGFVFTNLKANTKYEFLVRTLYKYKYDSFNNSLTPSDDYISNVVRTGSNAGTIDKDNKLGYRTKAEKLGQTANVVIGSDTLNRDNNKLNYILDLTREELAGSKQVVVSIPTDVILAKSEKLIKIIGSDYTLSFSPNVFENATLKANAQRADAGVKFKLTPMNQNLVLRNAKDKSADVVSKKYLLEAKTLVGSTSEDMDLLNGTMDIILDYDVFRAKARRLKTINLAQYDSFEKSYKQIASGEGGTAIGEISELGTYLTIGARR